MDELRDRDARAGLSGGLVAGLGGGLGLERLVEILDLNPDGVVVLDAESLEIEYVNEAAARLAGRDPVNLIGSSGEEIDPALTRARLEDWIARLDSGDAGAEFSDTTLRTAAGEEVPLEHRTRLVRGVDGSRHVISVVRDLRPRRASEELVRTSGEAFRTAFECAPVGAVVSSVDRHGRRITMLANQAMADMLGTTVDRLVGQSLDDATHPDERALEADLFRHLACGDLDGFSLRKRMRRTDGSEIWVEGRVATIALPGFPAPLAITYKLDVSDLVTVQSRQEREKTLTQSVAEVTTGVLADEEWCTTLGRIVKGATLLVGADGAVLVLGSADSDGLRVEAVHGQALAGLERGTSWEPSVAGDRFVMDEAPGDLFGPRAPTLGPVAGVHFGHVDGQRGGYLCVVRRRGEPAFTTEDVDDLARLAHQARLALQLSWARHVQERLALVEERQRIARDLHDGVVQDVIALGMEILARAGRETDISRELEDREIVARLEGVVEHLRREVLELRQSGDQTVGAAVRDLAAQAARSLGHEPDVVLEGDVEHLDNGVVADVLRVVREALSNVARHAGARHTRVLLEAGPERVTLTVEDDGVGLRVDRPAGHGLENMRDRATARDGRLVVGVGDLGGAKVVWSVPRRGGGR